MFTNPLNDVAAPNIPPYSLIEQGRGEPSREQLKTSRLVIETFQNLFKAIGLTQLTRFVTQTHLDFINHCRLGVLWTYHRNGLTSGELQQTLKKDVNEIITSPYEFSRFLNACRDMAELISIPLGVALKNESFSEYLIPVLAGEYKNLADKSFNLKIIEKNANLQSVFDKETLPGASINDKYKLMAEKVNASFEVAGTLSLKYNLQELAICLALASSITKVYILYLEKTNTPPSELLNILKMESELTIKLHISKLPLAFAESEYRDGTAQSDEFYQEIHHEIASHLNLISSSDNDGIYHDLLNYKTTMNQLFSIYHFKLENFNEEMDKLLANCKPLIAYRQNMEQVGTKLLQDHGLLLNEQLEKLRNIFKTYEERLNKIDFEQFVKPEFEIAIRDLEEQLQKNNTYLQELTIKSKFDTVPFTVLSMNEQKTWFDGIVKETNVEKKQKIYALVKNVCREV